MLSFTRICLLKNDTLFIILLLSSFLFLSRLQLPGFFFLSADRQKNKYNENRLAETRSETESIDLEMA